MKNYIYKNINNQKGFSLVELLVAMAVFSIVVAGIVASKISQQNQTVTQKQAVEMQQNVRAAISMMVYEIRMAGYNPYAGSTVVSKNDVGISNAGVGTKADTFTFAYVADDDGIDNTNPANGIDEKGEIKTISYFLDGNNLYLNDGGIDKLIAENMLLPTSGNIFTYLDSTGSVTAALNDINAVTINLISTVASNELDRTDGTNSTRVLRTTVKCRNLGL